MGGDESTNGTRSARAVGVGAAISDADARVEVLTAFMGGIVFEFDREGRYLHIGTGDPALLTRPAAELIGRPISEGLSGREADRFHEAVARTFDTGEGTSFEYSLDVMAGRRTFSCEVRRHDPRSGAARTVVVLVRDVTRQKELEAKLVQAERLAALGLLAASVGHEIRQPLAYVLTSLDALGQELSAPPPSPATQRALENIRSGALRIAEIAGGLDLLADQRKRRTVTLDVRRPVQAALDLCASELRGRARLEKHLGVVPPIRGDEGELCQVVANLLLNAAHAIEPGAPERNVVTVSTSLVGDQVRISVQDTGEGIAEIVLAHVFDPFYTTKDKHKGTGLGLFITKNIVDAHRGTLELVSEVGKGTTVHVRLPASPSAMSMPAMGAEPVTGTRARALRERLSVLVVDDEPRFLDSLRLALDVHDVTVKNDASEAVALLARAPRRFDVVLCDLSMPGIDGVAFYEHMVALGVGDRFILMTGGATTARASEFVALGVCRTVNKPFPITHLLNVLDEVTRDRSAS